MAIATYVTIVEIAWVARKDSGLGSPEQPLLPTLRASAFTRVPTPFYLDHSTAAGRRSALAVLLRAPPEISAEIAIQSEKGG